MAGPSLPLPPPVCLPGSLPRTNEGVRLEGGLRRGQDRACVCAEPWAPRPGGAEALWPGPECSQPGDVFERPRPAEEP